MSFSVFLSVVGKYIGPLVIYMVIAAAIYIPCRLLYLKRKQRAFAVWHELFLFLFWVYAFGVFSQTVLPRFYIGVTDSGAFYFDTYIPPRTAPNFMPFATLRLFWENRGDSLDWSSLSFINLLGNLLLFLPIGFLLPAAYPRQRRFYRVFLLSFLGILGVEVLQYFFGRVADVDDVLLNSISIVIGYFLFAVWMRIYKAFQKRRGLKSKT